LLRKKKICFTAVIEASVRVFLTAHMKAMGPCFDISVAVNTKDRGFLNPFGLDINVEPVPIERKISPLKDLRALLKLYALFRKSNFDAVHSIMPKSGLLSMVAGFLAGVPVRIHTFTGQVWATRRGIARWYLKMADKMIATCATYVLVDSHSQRSFLVKEKVVSEAKSRVIANGSICGVDEERFTPDNEARRSVRAELSIAESDILFLFLGRLTIDKGLLDLAQAFERISGSHDNARLLVVGPDEEDMRARMLASCDDCADKVYFVDFTETPEKYMAAADVLCLPSYREGFGMTVIEAGSVGIPSIGTRIYGIEDTIEDGVTGLLFPIADVNELALRMEQFIANPSLLSVMGKAAQGRARQLFGRQVVVQAMVEFYKSVLLNQGSVGSSGA
jgi:glycosyltransferase involved in cell wall biosynthesis